MVSNDCFISYRRATSAFVARAVFQDLRAHEIDAFLDVEAIDEGDFRRVIDAQIRQRPYFLPILSPAALKRCREANDLLCKEYETAVQAERRVVPIVTTEFDRKEISECLPEPLATRFLAFNSVTVDHEYFEAAMGRLRTRFLKPVEVPQPVIDPVIARDAERLKEVAVAQVPIGQAALGAQRHFERAFAAAAIRPELAATEFGMGSELLKSVPERSSLLEDFDLTFLQLQAQMQGEQARFTAYSDLLKAKHDEVKLAISSIR